MRLVKVMGLLNVPKFREYAVYNFVDIAYVKDVRQDSIVFSADNSIDLNNAGDRKWIAEIISHGLSECEEFSAQVMFE